MSERLDEHHAFEWQQQYFARNDSPEDQARFDCRDGIDSDTPIAERKKESER